jgi:hypothetical protein
MSKPEPARRDAEAVYRSPEERGRHPIDGRSNVYSLGAILWAAFTGAPPLRAHHGGVPAVIEAVITRAMEVEPARRYSGAREFVLAAAAAFASQSEAVRPTDAVASTRRQEREAGRGRGPGSAPVRRPPAPVGRPPTPATRTSAEAASGPAKTSRSGNAPSERIKPRADSVEARAGSARARPSSAERRRKTAQAQSESNDPGQESAHTASVLGSARTGGGSALAAVRVGFASAKTRLTSATARLSSATPRLGLAKTRLASRRAVRRTHAAPHRAGVRRPARGKLRGTAITGTHCLMAGAVLACALAGLLLGRTGGEAAQPARLASSALSLRLAPGWEQSKVADRWAIDLSNPVAAAPGEADGSGIVVGRVRDTVAAERLLAAQGTRRTGGARVGHLEAWRYTGLRPNPNTVATGYWAPTTGGPLVVICYLMQPHARLRLPECERMASTSVLRGASGIPLSTVERRQEQFSQVMSRLRRDRIGARRRLARARLARRQAGVARQLERSYRRAAGRLAQVRPSDGTSADHLELVRSLRATADAYAHLARAAAKVDRSRYRRATRAVRQHEAAVLRRAARASGP